MVLRKKGFTLIELLVVIAIIALLLAILMPALGKVKEKAKQITCGAHMHNISLVLNLYASDYDSKLPAGPANQPPREWLGGWLFDFPYNVAEDVRKQYQVETMFCPASTMAKQRGGDIMEWYSSHMLPDNNDPLERAEFADKGWAVSDYFWLMTFGLKAGDHPHRDVKLTYPVGSRYEGKKMFVDKLTVRNASSYPLVVDKVWTKDAAEPMDFQDIGGGHSMTFPTNHLNGNKATGGNVLKCDGSVEWVRYEAMTLNYSTGLYHYW